MACFSQLAHPVKTDLGLKKKKTENYLVFGLQFCLISCKPQSYNKVKKMDPEVFLEFPSPKIIIRV
jgi:hypothetical protein